MSDLVYQQRFSVLVTRLLMAMFAAGHSVTFGHAYRCDDCKVGVKYSLHKRRLALDINLFKDGKYLDTTNDHRAFGQFWEGLAPECRWGGRFNDGNHYELVPGGWR